MQVDHYEQFHFEKKRLNVRPLHACATAMEITLQCIDEHGTTIPFCVTNCIIIFSLNCYRSFIFVYCNCEALAVTLMRAQLWPATPHYPRYAFSFQLLDLAESLLLECHVALKDFCEALYFRYPFPPSKVCVALYWNSYSHDSFIYIQRRDIYSCLINSFEEYR